MSVDEDQLRGSLRELFSVTVCNVGRGLQPPLGPSHLLTSPHKLIVSAICSRSSKIR